MSWHPDPIGHRLRQAALIFRSTTLRGLHARAITRHDASCTAAAIVHGHDFWPRLPTQDAGFNSGDLNLGSTPAGLPIRLDLRRPGGLTVIIGPPNAGKSLLLYRYAWAAQAADIWTLFIDTKHAAGHSLPIPQPMLTPAEAAFSLAPPPGTQLSSWLHQQITLLESTLYLHSGSLYLIESAERLQRAGETCWAAVAHDIEQQLSKSSRWSRAEGFRESAYTALRRLVGGHALFSASRMLPWSTRLREGHGIYLGGLPAEASRLAVLLVASSFVAFRRAQQINNRATAGLLLLDDARVVLKTIGRTGQAAVEPVQHLLDTAQSAGLGLVACVQSTSELGPALLGAAETIILVGPQDGADLELLQPRLQLTHDQQDDLRHQVQGHAVFHARSHAYPAPFPLTLSGPDTLSSPHQAQAAQAASRARLLVQPTVLWIAPSETHNSVASPPGTEPASRSGSTPPDTPAVNASNTKSTDAAPKPLSRELHALLLSALQHPERLQVEHGAVCSIQGRELTALRDQLVNRGCLRAHRLLRYALWEATPSAAALVGIEFKPLAGVGSFPHRWCQERLCRKLLADGYPRVVVEYQDGDQRYDVYAEATDGQRLACEIVLDLATLDRAVEKLSQFNGDGTLIVPDSRISATIKRTNATALFKHRLTVETIRDLLTGLNILHDATA